MTLSIAAAVLSATSIASAERTRSVAGARVIVCVGAVDGTPAGDLARSAIRDALSLVDGVQVGEQADAAVAPSRGRGPTTHTIRASVRTLSSQDGSVRVRVSFVVTDASGAIEFESVSTATVTGSGDLAQMEASATRRALSSATARAADALLGR